MYMKKIAVGPEAVGQIDINAPTIDNLKAVADAKNKAVEDLVAIVLERPRHHELVEEIRQAGARIKLIPDGDVAAAINKAFEDMGVDILLGIVGAPEEVLDVTELKCLVGEIQGKLIPTNDKERKRCLKLGIDLDKVFGMHDFCSGDDAIFAATGVTDGK